MRVVAWAVEETQDAQIYEIGSLEQLWTLVRERMASVAGAGERYIHEISAIEKNENGNQDLVLAWVEVES